MFFYSFSENSRTKLKFVLLCLKLGVSQNIYPKSYGKTKSVALYGTYFKSVKMKN